MSTFPKFSTSDLDRGYNSLASHRGGPTRATNESSLFASQFLEQLVAAARPQLQALIEEVLAERRDRPPEVLCVDYQEAGRMIGTSYEGIRKLVRKGKLTSVSRSGRHRGIAVNELRSYIERNQVEKGSRPVGDE